MDYARGGEYVVSVETLRLISAMGVVVCPTKIS